MPLFHIGGSGWALCAMSRGGRSIILRDVDPVVLLELIATEHITEMFVVPAVLMVLLATPSLATTDLSSLRLIFYGASPISEDVLVKCMAAFGCGFCQVYGMTETTGAITALPFEDHDPDGPRRGLLRSAGKPHESVELRIVDPDTGSDAEIGEVGEVWTRSPYNMAGYWGKPDETAATMDADGWLRTGDAGYFDAEGYLYLHDRIKDMIVSGGENIYPAEVENVLLSHPVGRGRRGDRRARREVGRDGQGHRGAWRRGRRSTRRASSRTAAPIWRTTSARRRSMRWPPCRAIPPARSSSASSGPPTGREAAVDQLTRRSEVRAHPTVASMGFTMCGAYPKVKSYASTPGDTVRSARRLQDAPREQRVELRDRPQ